MLLFGALSKAQVGKNSGAQMFENESTEDDVRARQCEEGNLHDAIECRLHCRRLKYHTGHCREFEGEWRYFEKIHV
ncbi:unnamed protein product [Adineta steineri]|uniref:Uncharacterized protein n=1 Tax=Adineta steineri TaxID=433720 RepID=A0A819UUS1_9BILA|nr:unnamed protein product [Adineta steineri]